MMAGLDLARLDNGGGMLLVLLLVAVIVLMAPAEDRWL